MTENSEIYGVIGAGSFGTAVANLLAENAQVLLYARNKKNVDKMQSSRVQRNQDLHQNITVTNNIKELTSN